MTKHGLAVVAVLGSMMSGMHASSAQVVGEYDGRNSDGFGVRLVVYQDASGKKYVTYAQEAALFYCDGKLLLTRGMPLSYGTALETQAPIANGKASFAGSSNDLSALQGTVSFKGSTASGTLIGYAALFVGKTQPPNDTSAKSCMTRDLTFTAAPANPL